MMEASHESSITVVGKDKSRYCCRNCCDKVAELGLNIDDISQETVLDEFFTMMAVVSSEEQTTHTPTC